MRCPVHFDSGCSCRWARKPGWPGPRSLLIALAAVVLSGCGLRVTPADRAAGYAAEAKTMGALCKAYRFDRATGLVAEVPSMAKLCP